MVTFMFCEFYLKCLKICSWLEIAKEEGEKDFHYKETKPGIVSKHRVGGNFADINQFEGESTIEVSSKK